MNPAATTRSYTSLPPGDSGERERILLVDDEPQVLVALEDLLSDDFVVLKTDSPEKALRIIKDD
jgi:hypothetical protein